MEVSSSAFKDGQAVPKRYTGDGEDISPPLMWANAPNAAASFALICDDPDAPNTTWVHWVYWNIPADKRELPEGVATERKPPTGGVQGTNDFGNLGYGGPAPPQGHGVHRYYFKLYALNVALDLEAGATKEDLIQAMEGHIVAEAQTMGRYERR